MTVTVTDLFCGAGGSGLGAEAAGATLQLAANHSQLAIETHEANFPDCDHDVADISQVEPRRYRRSTILWASPECTWQSGARGKRRDDDPQQMLFGGDDPNEVAERSRSTMWDVPRFTEWHYYDAVIVENVVETVEKWPLWPAWRYGMELLGYRVQVVSLNSMHAPAIAAPRAPQSRDRIYVVCTRQGATVPDVAPRPRSWCTSCADYVDGYQWWKRHPAPEAGRYGPQYLYRCPTCREIVAPLVVPAAEIIDWSDPGQVIGTRPKPLRPATMARIQAGLNRFAGPPALVPAGGTWNTRPYAVDGPLRTRTTVETDGLLVPSFNARGTVRSTSGPLAAQTTRHETALVVPYYGTGVAQPAERPLMTMGTVDTAGVAFLSTMRGGGSKTSARRVSEPIATVSAGGQHHMLVEHPPAPVVRIEDCSYRMLSVAEIGAGMAFRPDYVIKGSAKRDRVRQLGNAVTPPAAEYLIRAVASALEVS